ncbi:MAG: hypothetical protein HY788_19945 [Deltaproteobacteria bacterium]|nr:hypothetical protein [Deltaproteobacteria bacterium]
MKTTILGVALAVLLMGMANANGPIAPDLVNNAVVSMPMFTCEPGHAFYLRTLTQCEDPTETYPYTEDVCTDWPSQNPQTSGQDYEGNQVGGVGGTNWPAGSPEATYPIRPYPLATDGPGFEDRPCVDSVMFAANTGPNPYQGRSFSYFVYDMQGHEGCQVQSATLKFKVSPWYSGSAQPGNSTTVHFGVYDMNDACENMANDGKRTCFGSLIGDPIVMTFPHSLTDYAHYERDVTQAVQTDLNQQNFTGYVGFMIGSESFGANNVDAEPGARGIGMTEFVLEVTLGECNGGPTPGPTRDSGHSSINTITNWGAVVFLLCLMALSVWKLRKRNTGVRRSDS